MKKTLITVMVLAILLLASCTSVGDKYTAIYQVTIHGKYSYLYVDSYEFTPDGWCTFYTPESQYTIYCNTVST